MASKSPAPSKAHTELLQIVKEYREEAESARKSRMLKNRRNWDIYMGNIDWSHKTEGQSAEHLPKMANSAEQMTAFIRRALTQFGPWFSCELPRNAILSPEQARALLMRFLDKVVVSRMDTANFATILGDAVKQALMESLIIFKVHGCYQKEHSFRVEPGDPIAGLSPSLAKEEHSVWRLRIDLVASDDFFPDPTGRGLYRIHRVERDWLDVWNMANGANAIYDKKIVQRIHDEMDAEEQKSLKARHRGQSEANSPRRRKRVVVEEVWGTLLGTDGRPLEESVVMAVANEKHVIREPEDIGSIFWHGEDPFVVAPVVRVPHSTWHKALYDNVAPLNLALDELFNLIIDGGLAGVWGVRQVRENYLADPRQISNGIPQGATLIVSEDAPTDVKVVETVTTGTVPPESLAIFNITDREQLQASMSNDTRLGNLPQRQVKATELVQAEQNSSVLLDGFTGDLERGVIVKVLEKSWLNIMQFADDIPAREVVDAIGVGAAFKLSRMSEAERYAMFAQGMKFKAHGLSGTLARAREFQKFMALNQGIATNPILMQAFLQRFSGDKTLTHLMRSLNINPEDLEMNEEELAMAEQTKGEVAQLAQITGGGTPTGPGGGGDSMSSSRSEINQDAAPTSGVG